MSHTYIQKYMQKYIQQACSWSWAWDDFHRKKNMAKLCHDDKSQEKACWGCLIDRLDSFHHTKHVLLRNAWNRQTPPCAVKRDTQHGGMYACNLFICHIHTYAFPHACITKHKTTTRMHTCMHAQKHTHAYDVMITVARQLFSGLKGKIFKDVH